MLFPSASLLWLAVANTSIERKQDADIFKKTKNKGCYPIIKLVATKRV
jgi:hypothetical protein